MKLPTPLFHRHHILSRRTPAVLFPFSLPTSVQRHTLSLPLLQFRPSSSSGSDDVNFQRNLRRLIAAQRAFDGAETKGGFSIRKIIQRPRTMAREERRAMMAQYVDAERERLTTVHDMLKAEVDRINSSGTSKIQGLMGPEKVTKFARMILERAAEPSYRLTPDDLKMVEKAVFSFSGKAEKIVRNTKAVGFVLGAGFLYYLYTILNRSP